MKSTSNKKWSEQDDEHIRKNLLDGTVKLSNHFGVSLGSIRKRCNVLGLSLRLNKAETSNVTRKPKVSNSDKFNPNMHKIKNNSTLGKIPFEIKSERMTVYLTPEQNNDKYKQSVINKYANRHKPIV